MSIPFNDARGAASLLQMAPPFAFSDVTMSVFPLRASLPTLSAFCRNYLNQAPDLVQFQPFIPYVYLVILDYGRMSVEAANMGWISQREVAFGVPMRWLSPTADGGLQFYDWAFTSPFIFVDNELSMATGREVFGWPKLLAKLDPSVSEWVRDPHGARRVFEVSTERAKRGYEGETSSYQTLLSVYQHRSSGIFDLPPNLDTVTKPISQMAGMTASMARLSMEMTKTFVGMASDGITGSSVLPDMLDMETFKAQLEPDRLKSWLNAKNWTTGIKDSLWSMFPRAYANTINFKQFRDTADPKSTCYQAITSAKMPVTSFKQGGFLGPQNMLMGQLDGGFHIDIHDLAGLPIVDSLGLEVADTFEANGTTVSRITPVAPLWMKVDMTYGLGETVVWRGRRDKWNEGTAQTRARNVVERRGMSEDEKRNLDVVDKSIDKVVHLTEDILDGLPQSEHFVDLDDPQQFNYLRTMNYFNTARGASEAVGGSFSMPDASVRVLPIKADPKALQKFAADYLKIEGHMRFEAWGDFAYLVISDFKHMNSQQSGIANRRAREMSLLVPVKAYKWYSTETLADTPPSWDAKPGERDEHGREKLLTTGFVNAFTFVDNVETSITANEVFGVPCLSSTVIASENDWLSRNRGARDVDEHILQMNAKVLPELRAGAKAIDRTLIEVSGNRDHSRIKTHETRATTVNRWIETIAADLKRKNREAAHVFDRDTSNAPDAQQVWAVNSAQGFALGLLAGKLPFNQFSLKQFRDSEKTAESCYQGLVQRSHRIRKISDVSELPGPLHVTITDFPTQPISEILGLVPKFSYPGPDRIVRVFEPIRPFSFNGDLLRDAGMTLFERIGSSRWQVVDLPEQAFGWRKFTPELAESLPATDDENKGPRVEIGRDPIKSAAGNKNKAISEAKLLSAKSWFDDRRKAGSSQDIMIRFREQPYTVSVITNGELLDRYDPTDGTDLSAWYDHAMDEVEAAGSQADIAAWMERVSPATVIDKILSRQWGKTEYSEFYDRRYADFCVPVDTVPKPYAEKLFPSKERQGKYWPRSVAFHESDQKRWMAETNAFKHAMEANLRLLGLAYTSVFMSGDAEDGAPKDMSAIFNKVARELNKMLGADSRQIGRSVIQRAIASIHGEDDQAGIQSGFDELTFAFFNRLLPDKIKLGRDSMFGGEASFDYLMKAAKDVFTEKDWRDLAHRLALIKDKMSELLRNLPTSMVDLDTLIQRARDNAERVADQELNLSPSDLLTHRLRKNLSGFDDRERS